MKPEIHPTWFNEATVVCQCGNTWTTGATVEDIRTEICSNCHPFYTGEQRIVDTEGRVDKFMKRLQVREQFRQQQNAQEEDVLTPAVSMSELGLNKRYLNVMDSNGIVTVQDVLDILEENGDEGILEISGLGQQALSEIKKVLRSNDFDVPETEEA